MRYSLVTFFILIITYLLDRISAQYVYFLAFEHGFFDSDKLISLESIKEFYFLRRFWYFLWWVFLIFSFIAFLVNYFVEHVIDLSSRSDDEESDEESDEPPKPKPSARKRPRRPSHRYKSKRYKA